MLFLVQKRYAARRSSVRSTGPLDLHCPVFVRPYAPTGRPVRVSHLFLAHIYEIKDVGNEFSLYCLAGYHAYCYGKGSTVRVRRPPSHSAWAHGWTSCGINSHPSKFALLSGVPVGSWAWPLLVACSEMLAEAVTGRSDTSQVIHNTGNTNPEDHINEPGCGHTCIYTRPGGSADCWSGECCVGTPTDPLLDTQAIERSIKFFEANNVSKDHVYAAGHSLGGVVIQVRLVIVEI